MGNVTAIVDGIDPTGSRSYAYQNVHYLLTRGDGPWGELSWAYDKIGNRLSETRDGATSIYSYFPNAAGGSSPKLATVTESGGEVTRYFYDAIGDLTAVAGAGSKTRYSYDAARRLSRIAGDTAGEPPAFTDLRYDGRSFLDRATLRRFAVAEPSVETAATYSTNGLLYHRVSVEQAGPTSPRGTPASAEDVIVVYFAGRPVAQVVLGAGEGEGTTYLATDHLGTPALATNGAGAEVWSGGFEPFGTDWNGAWDAGVFLRFPGQWEDPAWFVVGFDYELHHNAHRWYQTEIGRYTRPDPLSFRGGPNLFTYAGGNPLTAIDSLGLKVELWCRRIGARGDSQIRRTAGRIGFRHCFVRIRCDCAASTGEQGGPYDLLLELTEQDDVTGMGVIPEAPRAWSGNESASIVPFVPADFDSKNCETENCIQRRYDELRTRGFDYGPLLVGWVFGPNSNTFAEDLLTSCGIGTIFWPGGVTGVK